VQDQDSLKNRGNVQFVTLNNRNVLPRSAKTQFNLTASSTIAAVSQPVTVTATVSR
jgi:hypothetical protein